MFLQDQGELALGSRLKALSERLYAIADEVYRASGQTLEARAFPLLRYLQVKGPATVTEIAAAIGQTHSAVSQTAARLRKEGWLVRRRDRADARRGLLDLSAEAEARLDRLGPHWRAIRRGVRAAAARCGGDLLGALAAFEQEVTRGELTREILAAHARIDTAKVEIHPYRAEWREHFYRLNADWLERHFTLEPIDRQVLSDPDTHVLAPGGAIFFAALDGEVIGTCALLKEAPGVYEVSKMAVEPGFRGRGAGGLLLDAVIAEFRRRRGRT
ncbi:MAG TPA: GNAT family N-acetyltransferase, partial [Mizugakiibacter sp.]